MMMQKQNSEPDSSLVKYPYPNWSDEKLISTYIKLNHSVYPSYVKKALMKS
jgi:hypothetical protein